MAQEVASNIVSEREEDILALPDPFSIPEVLRKTLVDMDRKIKADFERSQIKPVADKIPEPQQVGEPEPPPVAKPDFPSLNISGIIFSDSNPQVIINGDVFTTGDSIKSPVGEVSIHSIERNQVTFTFLGDSYIRGIGEEDNKRQSKK
ncbi:MAG: hypothetical protein HQL21_01300 [Candidatus Omnitrophica bacterium]|nr:hypothetical protein [Candidatus Omnitrophota bacterium]